MIIRVMRGKYTHGASVINAFSYKLIHQVATHSIYVLRQDGCRVIRVCICVWKEFMENVVRIFNFVQFRCKFSSVVNSALLCSGCCFCLSKRVYSFGGISRYASSKQRTRIVRSRLDIV